MKKFCMRHVFVLPKTNYKTFLVMKLTILLTLFTTLTVSASLYSQDTKLNLSVKDKTLKEVIRMIESQSNFRFFYSDDYMDINKKVTINAQNQNIKEVMSALLAEGSMTYKVLENNIVVLTPAAAQQTKISGKVTDVTSGEELPGVNVLIKGTQKGVTTDAKGNFSIEANNGDILVFSFIGYLSEEVTINGQTSLTVTLAPDVKKLEEVVVIGYGVVKKRDLTGAVSSVKSEDVEKTTSSNALQAMQAKLPGINMRQSSGEAGSAIEITLRGKRSIAAENDPLILVDGVEYGSTLDINPSDIESMDVLKDAASTAIYGTKGANGVIIITTKRGKAGKTLVNFNAFVSSNIPTNVPKVMYGDKEVQMLIDKQNYYNDVKTGNWGTSNYTPEQILTYTLEDGTTQYSIYQDKSYTDWADIILKNGVTQNYELSVSGGNDKTNYCLSLGSMDEQGLMKNDELKRYNGKITLDHVINNIFKAGGSYLFTYKDHDARDEGVFNQSLKMTTITHPYLSDGTLNKTPNPNYPSHCNPLLDEVDGAYQNNTISTRFFSNTYLEIKPIKNLIFKSMFSLDRSNSRQGIYQDYETVGRFQNGYSSYITNKGETTTKYTWDNTLNYILQLNKHDFTFLLGQSMSNSVYEENKIEGSCGTEHYYTSSFYDLSKISTSTATSEYTKYTMLSYFGRLNYKFNEKYLFQASLRADGSSTLAEGHKWGYFPSASVGWRVSEEPFMADTKNWLSNLKPRISWGVAGNAAVDAYETLTSLSTSNVYYYADGKVITGNIPSNMGNEDLKWETTTSYDLGLDFGFFDSRITGTIDVYKTKTNDLLWYKSIPPSNVYPSVISNIGKTEGQGLEISLNTTILKSKDFSYDINWSYTTSKDKVTYLTDGVEKAINGNQAYIIGQSVNSYYQYETTGCWGIGEYDTYKAAWTERHPDGTINYATGYGTPGTLKIVDRNDDGTLNADDKRIYERSPKHIFGMNNTFSYKGVSLSFLIYARLGGYLAYDMNSKLSYETSNWGDLDYWTYTHTSGKFPNPGSSDYATLFASYGASLLYEKADYIKIKDITLSYSLPKNIIGKAKMDQVKIYGSLKNYFTFSKIDNYDSERDGAVSFPLAKQMVVGINVQF
jgi:TonB-dependent starch-binding outer membrane protein SusC